MPMAREYLAVEWTCGFTGVGGVGGFKRRDNRFDAATGDLAPL